MDEYKFSNVHINNIETMVSLEQDDIYHDDFQVQKSESVLSHVHHDKIDNVFSTLRKNANYHLEMVRQEDGIQITNKMVDEGKLSTKQKIDRHNMKKSIRKKIAEEGDFLQGEQHGPQKLTGEDRVNFVAEAQLIHKSRNKEYNKFLSRFKNNTNGEISEIQMRMFRMRRRFWFDDGGDNSRIERFVKEYKCESGMTKFFKVEYVKENYSKALKKLNEIKGVAEYMSIYPETETIQGVTAEELTKIAESCEKIFKCSLNILGYEFTEDTDAMEFSLERRESIFDSNTLEKSNKDIVDILNDVTYRNNMKNVDKELEEKFQDWTDKFRFGENETGLIDFVQKTQVPQTIKNDYEKRIRLMAYYNEQISYLESQSDLVKDENYSIRRISFKEKINELTLKKLKINEECRIIYGLCKNISLEKELTIEQLDYYTARIEDDRITKKYLINRVLMPYSEISKAKSEEISLDKLMQNAEKMSKRIRRSMKPIQLIEMQSELYELDKALKTVNISELDATNKYYVQRIKITAAKARAAALFIANEKADITKSNFSTEDFYVSKDEKIAIKEKYGAVNRENIRKYAIDQAAILETLYEDSYAELINNSQLRKTLNVQERELVKDMSENDILDMLHKMSVGVFEETTADENTLNFYRNQNLEGLKIYKQNLLKHYKRLYAKYGLEWIDLGEYTIRYKEMKGDFTETQVHDMLRNDPENFDFTNPDDRLLYELIAFYRPMIASMDGIKGYFNSDEEYIAGSTESGMDKEWMAKDVAVHLAYLKEHEGELK